ncbi:MAG: Uncharacterised protein [Cryomorphaceae bacterium]|nr:MAG: Uncharacterised protein [Cryomorphaceae bacterium]
MTALPFYLRQTQQVIGIDDHHVGLLEHADLVFQAAEIDTILTADRSIDHGQ